MDFKRTVGQPPMAPEGSAQLRARIPGNLKKQLQARAAAEGVNESKIVRDALTKHLIQSEAQHG